MYNNLKQTKMSFFQNKELEGKTGAVWWLAPLVGED
jgi:hypothetical protein